MEFLIDALERCIEKLFEFIRHYNMNGIEELF